MAVHETKNGLCGPKKYQFFFLLIIIIAFFIFGILSSLPGINVLSTVKSKFAYVDSVLIKLTQTINETEIYSNPSLQINISIPSSMKIQRKGFMLESVAVHDFKSPYVYDPPIPYDKNTTRAPGKRKMKDVLLYNLPSWYSSFNFENCPYNECSMHKDRNKMAEASMVVFYHTPNIRSKVPDRPVGQIWVYSSWESPVHYGYPEPYDQWKDVFNWTASYVRDADIFAPYGKISWRDRDTLPPDSEYEKIAKAKTKSVAWFVSNCNTPSRREQYVNEMKKYIDVDIYGKCGMDICQRNNHDKCMEKLNTTYKFYLSFENSICKDYVTEKLWNMYGDGYQVIPVTRGGFEYNKFLPPGTFINAVNFKSPKELALYLKALGGDVKRYAAMLKEKGKVVKTAGGLEISWCKVCEFMHTSKESKFIKDIRTRTHKNTCWH